MDRVMVEAEARVRGGAIGYLTSGVMGRTELYAQGLIAAMAPFARPELYATGVEAVAKGSLVRPIKSFQQVNQHLNQAAAFICAIDKITLT